MTKSRPVFVCGVVLALAFSAAASYKIVHFREFQAVLRRIGIIGFLPDVGRAALGSLILGIEASLAVMLMFGSAGSRRTAGRVASGFLIVVSSVVLIYHQSIASTCDCMWRMDGVIPDSGVVLVLRNSVLLGLSTFVGLFGGKPSLRDSTP